jgi:hypothetical protein
LGLKVKGRISDSIDFSRMNLSLSAKPENVSVFTTLSHPGYKSNTKSRGNSRTVAPEKSTLEREAPVPGKKRS